MFSLNYSTKWRAVSCNLDHWLISKDSKGRFMMEFLYHYCELTNGNPCQDVLQVTNAFMGIEIMWRWDNNLPNVERRWLRTGQSTLPQLELLPEAFRPASTASATLHVRLYLIPLFEKEEQPFKYDFFPTLQSTFSRLNVIWRTCSCSLPVNCMLSSLWNNCYDV